MTDIYRCKVNLTIAIVITPKTVIFSAGIGDLVNPEIALVENSNPQELEWIAEELKSFLNEYDYKDARQKAGKIALSRPKEERGTTTASISNTRSYRGKKHGKKNTKYKSSLFD